MASAPSFCKLCFLELDSTPISLLALFCQGNGANRPKVKNIYQKSQKELQLYFFSYGSSFRFQTFNPVLLCYKEHWDSLADMHTLAIIVTHCATLLIPYIPSIL